jgi:hypothetical protein
MAQTSRAREAERSRAPRSARQSDAAPRLPSDVAAVADSILAICGSRRTMELGRSGRNAGVVAAAPAAMERSAAPGERRRYGVVRQRPDRNRTELGGVGRSRRTLMMMMMLLLRPPAAPRGSATG